MGWKKTDWAYSRLTIGIHRLVGVRLSYQNLWRDNHNKQWRGQGAFGILDSLAFRDNRPASGGESFCEQSSMFRWSAVLFQSFDSGYLKRIDYGLTRSLSATARRLYRYLDKHFHLPHKTRIVIDLNRLAYQHIGISPGIEPDKVRKRYIGPAADELEQVGYLRKTAEEVRFEKVRRGQWNVAFELATGKGHVTEIPSAGKLVKALCKREFSEHKSARFVQEHSEEALVLAIRAMMDCGGKRAVHRRSMRTKGWR